MAIDTYISKQYVLCTLFPHGKKNIFEHNLVKRTCVTFAGVWDLLMFRRIGLDEKDVPEIRFPLTDNLLFLSPLYDYISKSKHIKYNKIIENFVLTSGSLFDEYINRTVDILVKEESLSPTMKVGLFKTETVTPPKMAAFESIIETIKNEAVAAQPMNEQLYILNSLLIKTGFLKNYYLKAEADNLISKMENTKKAEHTPLVHKFIHEMEPDLWDIIKNT